MGNVYIALLHYPVFNKNGEIVTTAVTNFDIHDIARSARTYDLERYFIIHPVREQAALVRQLVGHWQTGFGATYNPDRKDALSIVSVCATLDEVTQHIETLEGQRPQTVYTTANQERETWSYPRLRTHLESTDCPVLLVFGTGYGIEPSFFERADIVLDPVMGPGPYNHLCVRAAVSIILDRLRGQ